LEDGNFAITFNATIAEGFHGYSMKDTFSTPVFEFESGAKAVGEVVEPLTAEEHPDGFGGTSIIYYNNATYIYTVDANAGCKVKGYISATICTNDTNQCTSNYSNFEIVMPGEAVVAAAQSNSTSSAAPLDWGSIITAILWGFAALLTPCVFPMVPMTVSFFVKGSQSPAQGRFRAFMYGFFIIALYVLPIAILVLLSNAFGTNVAGDIFNAIGTHWIPNLIFFVIFMIFAASFLGAFEITLPSSLVNKSDEGADKGGLVGIFFMALTLVLVSFSCTGPIVGSVIISSTSGGVWMPIITMAAFAIAFALPFTVLAWFPSLLKNLPKSGGWLNSVKVVLGFIEVALGLKFLMTADQTMHWGLLDREVYLAIWIVTFSLLGLYLLGKLRFAHDDEVKHVSVFRLTLAIAVFSFVVYMIPGMFGAPLNAISGYIPPMSTQDYQVNGRVDNANTGRKYADFLHLPHQLEGHFDFEEAVEDAMKQNKPIFVDVTGHACNNCREMETMVWSHSSVLPMLQNDFVICALYVDDNTKVEDGKRLGSINSKFAQDRWGVNAQPGYILLSPDGETVLAGPRGYDTDIQGFVDFLNTAKNAM
jgi:thiol:disulfide interchange protein DsbD